MKDDHFLNGRAAMTINSYSIVNSMDSLRRMNPSWKPFHFDYVGYPADPSQGKEAVVNVSPAFIYSIHAKASNIRAAWELVKFVNSDEFAKLTSKTRQSFLSSRPAYMPEDEGRNVQAFYRVKVSDLNQFSIPDSFGGPYSDIMQVYLGKAIKGEISVEEAMDYIQREGQQALDKAWEQEAASKKSR